MPSDINYDAMFKNLGATQARLEKGRENAGHLISAGPFSIPNQFLCFDMRSDKQKAAQAEPGKFQTAMHDFLEELRRTEDKIHDLVNT